MDDVVAPVLHKKLRGAVPPLAVTEAVPSPPPKQLTAVDDVVADNAVGCVTVRVEVAVH